LARETGIVMTSLSKMQWSLAEDHLISPAPRLLRPFERPALTKEREAGGRMEEGWAMTAPAPNVADQVRRQKTQSRCVAGLKWLCFGGTIAWFALLFVSL